ncbi:MAG: flavin reductase family protein [Rhodobacteraceae bacterium]|nr:flavin reductase family protein [Paracoccaceae bacterium]
MTAPVDSPLEIEGYVGVNPAQNESSQAEFRRTLGQFATGVTAMTTRSNTGEMIGMTANSFNSLSLDPPLILWSIANATPSFQYFQVGDDFAVNVLSADQELVARRLAMPNTEKFQGISIQSGRGGVPLIDGCIAYLECAVWARYPGGDHDIVVGEVKRIFNIGKAPLLFHGGTFRSF